MKTLVDADVPTFDLHVRGSVPSALEGALLVATNRRNKDRRVFSRWHDSQTDLFRIDLRPGRPGRIRARVLSVDASGADVGVTNPFAYSTQPNHGLNIANGRAWATNLLFGSPLEVDIESWRPRRILRYLQPTPEAPQLSGTSHFAWSLDRRYAYFHQSLLERESAVAGVRSRALTLVEIDTRSDGDRRWEILPPPSDAMLETANFHSAFYFEEDGRRYVGLLRTGARLETLFPHAGASEHVVYPMPASTVWIVELDHRRTVVQASVLPGIAELGGLALSHLDVDATGGNGFVLFANYKQADVAEETHGVNLYGEPAWKVREHYAGMVPEAINHGMVIRYERRAGTTCLRTFSRPYDHMRTSLGHSWLPINIDLDPSRRWLFCTFSGFRPRLLSRHIAAAYPALTIDPRGVRYVPPLLMRFDASTLKPDDHGDRSHLAYAEPIAMTVAGERDSSYVCTFSPEAGLRIYRAEDLSAMVCHAVAPEFMNWRDSHFRPDPAHLQFTHR